MLALHSIETFWVWGIVTNTYNVHVQVGSKCAIMWKIKLYNNKMIKLDICLLWQGLFQILTSWPVERNWKTYVLNRGYANCCTGLRALVWCTLKFGHDPFGSVLSYQCPPEISKDTGAPKFPLFKFPMDFVPTHKQQCHLESLKISWEISTAIEAETRLQSTCQLWTLVRKHRAYSKQIPHDMPFSWWILCQSPGSLHSERNSSDRGYEKRLRSGTWDIR